MLIVVDCFIRVKQPGFEDWPETCLPPSTTFFLTRTFKHVQSLISAAVDRPFLKKAHHNEHSFREWTTKLPPAVFNRKSTVPSTRTFLYLYLPVPTTVPL